MCRRVKTAWQLDQWRGTFTRCIGRLPPGAPPATGYPSPLPAPHPLSPCHPLPAARAQRASQAVQGERVGIMDDMARLTVEAAAVGRALKVGAWSS